MNFPVYHIDAFHMNVFKGNPAAVCPLDDWLPDALMQSIAMENNLSETAFFVNASYGFDIRWFTPEKEVDLCGHATLASGHVIFNHLNYPGKTITFNSKSGKLIVHRHGDYLYMDFPAYQPEFLEISGEIEKAFDIKPGSAFRGNYLMLVYPDERTVRRLRPDLVQIRKLDFMGVIVTAAGDSSDFVSRFFAPAVGIDEDPVTGSAHCLLIPYWSEQLKKTKMNAVQCSSREGLISCEYLGKRVMIGGRAVTYSTGTIHV